MTAPKLLTASETAKRRRKTSPALTMERQRNEGPPYIVDGGRILYPEDELEKWLASRRVDPSLLPKPKRKPSAPRRKATS